MLLAYFIIWKEGAYLDHVLTFVGVDYLVKGGGLVLILPFHLLFFFWLPLSTVEIM